MNDFDSTETNKGILKNNYGSDSRSPIGDSLERRRKKLYDTEIQSQFNNDGLAPQGEEK